jgi:hypothetical protein
MSSNHRQIKALLYPNLLKNNSGTFKAQVITSKAQGIKDICIAHCSKPGSGINPDAMEYHVRLFLEEMTDLLDEGFAINTGYFVAVPTIKGSFNNKNDKFDAERHSVTYKFSQGALLRERVAKIQAEILHVNYRGYGIQQVKDTRSNTSNDLLTPGGALKIKGQKIKLTGEHPDVGIYFISETTGQRARVAPVNVITNQNSNLLILIPDLQPDSYRLELITQYAGKGTPLNEPRSATLESILRAV